MSMSKLSRVVWKVSLPVILAGASENLLHLIDTIFLARVGVTELGALAIADSVLLVFLVMPLGLAEAMQILASRRAGQRRPDAVGAAFNQGLLAVALICLGATAAIKVLSWGNGLSKRRRWESLSAAICRSRLTALFLWERVLRTARY